MKRTFWWIPTVILMLPVLLLVSCQQATVEPTAVAEPTAMVEPTAEPMPTATVEQTVMEPAWLADVAQTEDNFQAASESFAAGETAAAAASIRAAADLVQKEADRAEVDGRAALDASVADLNTLADDVEGGTVTAATDLDQVFARAHQALANSHYLHAMAAAGADDATTAGQELDAAAQHLASGTAWLGGETEAGTLTVIDDARLVAGKLIDGSGDLVTDGGDAIAAIGDEVTKLGERLEPAP